MKKIAIVTDSNSGITQAEAKSLNIHVLPMPFNVGEETFLEDIDLTQEEFYAKLTEGADISTSQPSPASVLDLWDALLKDHDEVVHIPMSSALSCSCDTAMMLASDYDGRVQVVDNQRISLTQKQSAVDAKAMADKGMDAAEIKKVLEDTKAESSIYVTVDTLKYLKKGGRITPAAAALGTLLKLKPVLQIQGGKLDAFAKARTMKQARSIMMNAIQKDCIERFGSDEIGTNMHIGIAHTQNPELAADLKAELEKVYPDHDIQVIPLSLSIACHIGPGALAITCTKQLDI